MQQSLVKPVVSLRLPEERLGEVDELVRRFKFQSRTDFMEKAIDSFVNELKTAKVVFLKEVTREQAKNDILKYLSRKPSSYVSDMADELGIDVELAFDVVKELMKEKRVKQAHGTS